MTVVPMRRGRGRAERRIVERAREVRPMVRAALEELDLAVGKEDAAACARVMRRLRSLGVIGAESLKEFES